MNSPVPEGQALGYLVQGCGLGCIGLGAFLSACRLSEFTGRAAEGSMKYPGKM
jgi:hypothetical protein